MSLKDLNRTPAIRALLGLYFIIFVIDWLFLKPNYSSLPLLASWGSLMPGGAISPLQFWRFGTYTFFHLSPLHLLSSLFGLYFFGSMLEQAWGSRRFLFFYFTCTILGALIFLTLSSIPFFAISHHTILGASGGILAILVACSKIAPHRLVRLLFPPISLTLRKLTWFYLGISAFFTLASSFNNHSEWAHLCSASVAWLFYLSQKFKPQHNVITFPKAPKSSPKAISSKLRPRSAPSELTDIDAILDKINEKGVESLTKRERQALKNASRKP